MTHAVYAALVAIGGVPIPFELAAELGELFEFSTLIPRESENGFNIGVMDTVGLDGDGVYGDIHNILLLWFGGGTTKGRRHVAVPAAVYF